MKNKLYIISAAILCLSVVLCACNKPETVTQTTHESKETATTAITETVMKTETVTYVDESGYHVVSMVMPSTEKRTMPPVPTHAYEPTYKTETLTQKETTKASVTQKTTHVQTVAQTDKPTATTQPVTVRDESNGISVIAITKDVSKGNDASIVISGTVGKEYTIEVYRNNNDLLKSESLASVTAQSPGVVTWNFSTANCDKGQRKIIIREKGSDKYLQTSINIL